MEISSKYSGLLNNQPVGEDKGCTTTPRSFTTWDQTCTEKTTEEKHDAQRPIFAWCTVKETLLLSDINVSYVQEISDV